MMSSGGLSVADVMALSNRNSNGGFPMGYGGYDGLFGGNNWFGALIIGALLGRGFFGGFGGFGGYGGLGSGLGVAAIESQVSNDFLFSNLGSQIESSRNEASGRFNQLENNQFNISKEVQQTNFNTAVGQASLSKEIGQIGYQAALGNKDVALQIANSGCATQGAIKDASYNQALGNANIVNTVTDCCCKTNSNIDNLKFTTTQEICSLGYKNDMNTRDIIANNNANTQAIRDDIVNLRLETRDSKIAELYAQINALQTSGIANQAAETAVSRVLTQLSTHRTCCGC